MGQAVDVMRRKIAAFNEQDGDRTGGPVGPGRGVGGPGSVASRTR